MRETTQASNFVFYVQIETRGFKLLKNEYPCCANTPLLLTKVLVFTPLTFV